jgi:Concanavalin A-like lectin/glucanases superfamily
VPDWLILVPVLALPVVLLLAFGGCSIIAGLDDHTAAPATTTKPDPYPTVVRKDGPVAYWRLNDASSPTALDSGPNLLHATYHGASSAEGVLKASGKDATDTSARFTGTGQSYVERDYSLRLNPAAFTVEAWVKLDVGGNPPHPPGEAVVACYSLAPNDYRGFDLFVIRGGGKAQVTARVFKDSGYTDVTAPLVGDQWHHLVVTFVGTTLTLYVDNSAQQPNTNAPYAENASKPLRIGAGEVDGQAPSFLLQGLIDEVAVYDHVLDANQVKAHYQAA